MIPHLMAIAAAIRENRADSKHAATLLMCAAEWRRLEDENKRFSEIVADVADDAMAALKIEKWTEQAAAELARICEGHGR